MSQSKKFYQHASVSMLPDEYCFMLMLNDKPAILAGGILLKSTSAALMQEVVKEWNAQANSPDGHTIDWHTMPLTRALVALNAMDEADQTRRIAELTRFFSEDTLLYQSADASALSQHQQATWHPWRQWAGQQLGHALRTQHKLAATEQPPALLHAYSAWLSSLEKPSLLVCDLASRSLHSCILGMAIASQAIAPQQAIALSFAEEIWHTQRWGIPPEMQQRHHQLNAELEALRHFLLNI